MQEITSDDAVRLGSPYSYVLGVTIDKAGKPNAIGLCWWTFTSTKPRLIAISISPERYSMECLDHCGEFVLCFPNEEQKDGAWLCGTVSGKNTDKFEEAGFKAVASKVVKPPIIEGSTVAYECKVVDKFRTGDHTLYIGEVVAIHGTPEKPEHLYTVHYTDVVSLSSKGKANFEL